MHQIEYIFQVLPRDLVPGGEDINYYYDIVDENDDLLPLKADIGKDAFIYRSRDINTLKIIPYTYNKIDTNTTNVEFDGRTRYIIEDKIITINLK